MLTIVARADLAESTRCKYRSALSRFLEAGGDALDASSLADYAETLTASGRAQLKAAVKLYSSALLDELKSQGLSSQALRL